MAGGAGLMLACDMVVATAAAKIRLARAEARPRRRNHHAAVDIPIGAGRSAICCLPPKRSTPRKQIASACFTKSCPSINSGRGPNELAG